MVIHCLNLRGSEEISVELRMLAQSQNKLQKQNKVFGMERKALILTID